MSEYTKLIDYLNSVIASIYEKQQKIHDINTQQLNLKKQLENTIGLINSSMIDKINVNELVTQLTGIIPESEVDDITKKITELSKMKAFLLDERITNPIKKIMLTDLDYIKARINTICSNIQELSLAEEDITMLDTCQKILTFIDEKGYTKILSDEERISFYEFLQKHIPDDCLLLISEYIIFANSKKSRYNANTSNTAMQIIDKNAEEVIQELKVEIKNDEDYHHETEPLSLSNVPNDISGTGNIDFSEIYNQIVELLKIHQNDVNLEIYDMYKNYFSKMNLYEIYGMRSMFLTANSINWEAAIPCIKEVLIPNIDSEYRQIVFKMLNEIVALNKEQLEEYLQEEKRQELHKNQFNNLKTEFMTIIKLYDRLKAKIDEITIKINKQTNNNKDIINSLLNIIQSSSKVDIGVQDYLKYYGIEYDELKMYYLSIMMQSDIDYIKEFIELEILSEEDFKGLSLLLEEVKNYISNFEEIYSLIHDKKMMLESQEQKEEITQNSKKQYESGKSVIIFFRKNENSKFLIEEDLDKQLIDEESYNDIHQILRRTSETPCENWGRVLFDKDHFKSFVHYNKQNGEKGDVVTVTSDYSGKKYELFRLKYKGPTIPRITAFHINMCDENRRKLGISQEKSVILVIGEKQVNKHSNESQEYSYFIREFKDNALEIKKYIELFENPNTEEKVLYRILNDSSDLYDYFIEKSKGLVI